MITDNKKDIEKLRNFCPEDNEQTREYIDKIKSILKSIDNEQKYGVKK